MPSAIIQGSTLSILLTCPRAGELETLPALQIFRLPHWAGRLGIYLIFHPPATTLDLQNYHKQIDNSPCFYNSSFHWLIKEYVQLTLIRLNIDVSPTNVTDEHILFIANS